MNTKNSPSLHLPLYTKGIFVSIQLNSNRPAQILRFLKNIQETASRPDQIEVLIHVDKEDIETQNEVEKAKSKFSLIIKEHSTNLVQNFFDLWKPLNELIQLTDSNAYFLMNVSDEFIFETNGWDDVLRRYVGYFPDHIFRVRTSQFRFRNYKDIWECGFAPDSLAFYTKRWFELSGNWNPCLGPDSFQQCVAFYLYSFDPFNMHQCNRDVADPFLRFSGEGANIGLEGDALKKRIRGHVREWFTLMSPKMQTEAKRRAMLLRAHIYAGQKGIDDFKVLDRKSIKKIVLRENILEREIHFSYRVPVISTILKNQFRKIRYHYFAGGGFESRVDSLLGGMVFYLSYLSPRFESIMENLKNTTLGRKIFLYQYSKKLKRNIRTLKEKLTPQNRLFLYGTGQYAKNILFLMRRYNMNPPHLIIEADHILKEKGEGHHLLNHVVTPQSQVLPNLTKSDYIVVGSLSFSDLVITRIKSMECRAKIVDLTVSERL